MAGVRVACPAKVRAEDTLGVSCVLLGGPGDVVSSSGFSGHDVTLKYTNFLVIRGGSGWRRLSCGGSGGGVVIIGVTLLIFAYCGQQAINHQLVLM